MPPNPTFSPTQEEARSELALQWLGFDRSLLEGLQEDDRASLRAGAIVWIVGCIVLSAAAGFTAHLIYTSAWSPAVGSAAMLFLTTNLLRVVNAGGGSQIHQQLKHSEAAARRYVPSMVPTVVFGVLAILLSQPAQLPFWPELDQQVEQHRTELLEQHEAAAAQLGSDATHYREDLQEAGFPIFQIALVWKTPARALRLSAIFCLFVLLPGLWARFVSLRARREYELLRSRRTHAHQREIGNHGNRAVVSLLKAWPSYRVVGRPTGASR